MNVSSYAEQMASKYGAMNTWLTLASANRAEEWPMPLNDLLAKVCREATPEQRMTVVRRSTRLALEAQITRWPILPIEATWPWWSPTVTNIRQRLMAWADGGPEDIFRLLSEASTAHTTAVVRAMPNQEASNYRAYGKAMLACDRVAAYEAAGVPDVAAAQAAYDLADTAASSVSADEPLIRYLASRGGSFEDHPIRGSLDHEALLADSRGARAAVDAALSVGMIATSASAKAEADWDSLRYICSLVDGAASAVK